MERPGKPKHYESPIGHFEVVKLQELKASDVTDDDRAFLHTQSGNRYMIRHSRSRGGELVIYSEREGFDSENARPFLLRKGKESIARVGEPLNYFQILDEVAKTGNEVTSTDVTFIEVRKGLEAAVRQHEAQDEQGFDGLAKMIRKAVDPTRKGPIVFSDS